MRGPLCKASRLIKGWDEGVKTMKRGERAPTLRISLRICWCFDFICNLNLFFFHTVVPNFNIFMFFFVSVDGFILAAHAIPRGEQESSEKRTMKKGEDIFTDFFCATQGGVSGQGVHQMPFLALAA